MVLVMDQNRANFEPVNWQQWPLAKRVRQETRTDLEPLPWNRSAGVTEAKFGPLWLFVVQP